MKKLFNIIVKLSLSILFFLVVTYLVTICVRLFINSNPETSFKIAFLFTPYLGALIMGFFAFKKGATLKQVLLYTIAGLFTTEKVGLISIIAFYDLLGRNFKLKTEPTSTKK